MSCSVWLARCLTLSCIVSKRAKITIVAMKCEQVTAPRLSNGAIFSDLEWPLTCISRFQRQRQIQSRALSATARLLVVIGSGVRPSKANRADFPPIFAPSLSPTNISSVYCGGVCSSVGARSEASDTNIILEHFENKSVHKRSDFCQVFFLIF